jgi:hypothetical protein
MVRVARGVVVAVLAVVAMTGCTPFEIEAPTLAPQEEPISDGWRDPTCADVTDEEQFARVWSAAPQAAGYAHFGATSVWNMQGSALIQAGALVCAWGSDDAESSVLLIALGDGADGFLRSEPSFGDPASGYVPVSGWDGAYVACRTDGAPRCHWNVLDDNTWISVLVRNVPAGDLEAEDLAATTTADLVAALVDRVASVEPTSVSSPPDVWSCASRLTPETVAEVVGVEVSRLGASRGAPVEYALGRSTPDFGQTMWAYAQELLGYRECHLSLDGQQLASIVSAPGGAWLLEDIEGLAEVPDLGPGLDSCETEADFTLCTVAVTRDDDLVVVQVPAEGSEDLARKWAAAIAAIIVA